MTDYEKIRVEREQSITIVTLNDPDRRNALSTKMIVELTRALESAREDGTRVVLLRAEGRIFSAGASFAEATGTPNFDAFPVLLKALFESEIPVVAAVAGHALGGGLGIVAASTFAIASREIEFGTPEVNLGLFPMMIMSALVRTVPRRKLLEMMLLGERISAEKALEFGLVSHVVEKDAVEAEARKLALSLADKSPSAIRRGLRALAQQDTVRLELALPKLRDELIACLQTEDAREGILAFTEKRPPRFTGK